MSASLLKGLAEKRDCMCPCKVPPAPWVSPHLVLPRPPAVDPRVCSTKKCLRDARAGIPENMRQHKQAGRADVKVKVTRAVSVALGAVVRLQGKN